MTDASLLLTILVLTGSGGVAAGSAIGFWLGAQSIESTVHGALIGYAVQSLIELLIWLARDNDAGPRMVVSEPPPQRRAW